MASIPTNDPERFKMVKNRLREFRVSHPQVFAAKGQEYACFVSTAVIEELDWLVAEHKTLCEGGAEHDQKKADAAYKRLEEVTNLNTSILEQHGFIKQVDSAVFRDMEWLMKDIERLDRLQPAERTEEQDAALLAE